MAIDPKAPLNQYFVNEIRDNVTAYLDYNLWDRFPRSMGSIVDDVMYKPKSIPKKYHRPEPKQERAWGLTCITAHGNIKIEIRSKGLPEEYVTLAIPRPVHELGGRDPRLDWDAHVSGLDCERVVCKRFMGTVYLQEGLN